MEKDGKLLLLASVANFTEDETWHQSFSANYGTFENGRFTCEYSAEMNKGPDQYAGQVFKDHKDRCILISWIPGWKYQGYVQGKDIGCMSLPSEIKIENGKMTAFPIEEVRRLLADSDEALVRTENGFTVARDGREALVYTGKIKDLKILRDGYVMEIFVNGGQEVYTVLL
jgi:sucrose-6-phosphate hydrolase SacC (GH32 family)